MNKLLKLANEFESKYSEFPGFDSIPETISTIDNKEIELKDKGLSNWDIKDSPINFDIEYDEENNVLVAIDKHDPGIKYFFTSSSDGWEQIGGKREIKPEELPQKALGLISKRQQSYIDEFKFYQIDNTIEAWYGGELLAVWDGNSWNEPNQTRSAKENQLDKLVKIAEQYELISTAQNAPDVMTIKTVLQYLGRLADFYAARKSLPQVGQPQQQQPVQKKQEERLGF
jgi:hypothetical protein